MKSEIFEIKYHSEFDKKVQRFIVKKNFKKLPDQIEELVDEFEKGNFSGDRITHKDLPAPHDVYKVRLPVHDINVGKSNGYRVVYIVVTEVKIVVFLTIYYKKEQPTVSNTYINGLIDGYFLNSSPEEE